MINTQIAAAIFFIAGIVSFFTMREGKKLIIDMALSVLCILVSIALYFSPPS